MAAQNLTDVDWAQIKTSAAGGNTSQAVAHAHLTTEVTCIPRAQVFVQGEQDLEPTERRSASASGNYAITDKTRLYGCYELAFSGHASTGSGNTGLLGKTTGTP